MDRQQRDLQEKLARLNRERRSAIERRDERAAARLDEQIDRTITFYD